MRHILVLGIIVSLSLACERVNESPVSANLPETNGGAHTTAQPPSSNGQVAAGTVAVTTERGVVNVTVEIAQTDEERARGLMGRESLPNNNGMWFAFADDVEDRFWMKDTTIPLDIIFVGSDNKIVDLIQNTVPLSTELLGSRTPYRYVLEVNAGFVADHGLRVGDQAQLRIGPAE
ncbi:MAG: DUF192 domain-containing protein [Deltaproteobacteria bacterium]|nr:DUF192 domain-containing protein [Deltaproteobacteria bacterium]